MRMSIGEFSSIFLKCNSNIFFTNLGVYFRRVGDTYEGTTWQIKFKLKNLNPTGIYKLRIAIAAAHNAELQVRN